jgi:hypothetical protein
MPQSASVGRSAITATQLSRVSSYTPAGFANPVASFARSVLSPIPTEQDSDVRASTSRWISRASAHGSCVDTPRNASSQPSTWTTASNERSVAITTADAASYAGGSCGRNTASGHLRAARRIGIPECTPNSRASYDAVATTDRVAGSPVPPTTTGLPRSSGRRSTSTAAMNWSRSTWSIQAAMPTVWRALAFRA